MSKKEEPKEPKHCDSYIHDFNAPMCLRWFLYRHRVPAIDGMLMSQNGIDPKLFADYEGKRVRVVMASRFGDVGITEDLSADHGYSARVAVEDLTNFSSDSRKPEEISKAKKVKYNGERKG